MKKTTYRGCDEYKEYSPSEVIQLNEDEYRALVNAIDDKIDTFNSVINRSSRTHHKRCWIEQVDILLKIKGRLRGVPPID